MRILMKLTGILVVTLLAGVAFPRTTVAFPSFSLTPGSPSAGALPPGSVLNPAAGAPVVGPQPPPVIGLKPTSLGLPPGGNIDDFSYGDESPYWMLLGNPMFYQFSVSAAATGGPWLPPAPPDNLLSQGVLGEGNAGGDIFQTVVPVVAAAPVCAVGGNAELYDANGFTALAGPVPGIGGLVDPPPPVVVADNVDGYEARGTNAVDFLTALSPAPPFVQPPDGRPDAAVFFTVDPPTAAGLGISPATVLVTDPASPVGFAVYAAPAMLGLVPGDDIDALMVADSLDAGPGPGGSVSARAFAAASPSDVVVFSLAPGSPSLAPGPLPGVCGPIKSPGDLWSVSPLFTGGAPAALASAEQMGLCSIRVGCAADDNLDAVSTGWLADIDNDGLPDPSEAACGAGVGLADTDGDGLNDGIEAMLGGTPAGPCTGFPFAGATDSDGDGMSDGWEVTYFTGSCPGAGPNPSLLDAAADPDGEGAANLVEMLQGTSPCIVDTDADGNRDLQSTSQQGPTNTNLLTDNCPNVANALQLNTDGNFIDNSPPYVPGTDDKTRTYSDQAGDACDGDDDNDALTDSTEALALPCATATGPTLSTAIDSDDDHVADGAECAMGSDPADPTSTPPIPPPVADTDGDRLSNVLEGLLGSNPAVKDTDGDGAQDGWEYKGYNSNLLSTDTDGDGTKDGCEIASINGDKTVNPGDQALLAAEIIRVPPPAKLANFDLNKDGTINVGDQAFMASRTPPGVCPP